MIPKRAIALLVAAACVLPLSLAIVLVVARLLSAMQDAAAATALDYIALALLIVWLIDLVCLLIALAINSLGPRE